MPQKEQNDAALTDAVIESLLVRLVRCQPIFNLAYDKLEPEYFNQPGEIPHKAIWYATRCYHEQHNNLPNLNVLETESVRALQDSSDYNVDNENKVIDLARWVFDEKANPEAEFDVGHSRQWVKEFLLDRCVGEQLRADILTSVGRAGRLPKILNTANDNVRIVESLNESESLPVIPLEWEQLCTAGTPIEFGLPFVDSRMSTVCRDVNVVLGPTGVGKTTLSMQMLASAAKIQRRKESRGGTGELSGYFSYEDGFKDPRVRLISYLARISKTRLENMRSYNDLSRSASNLLPYERENYEYIFGNGPPISEYDRLQAVMEWVPDFIKLYDFSGSKESDGVSRGFGGVSEIRQMLEDTMYKTKKKFNVVFIDWAGLLVDRYLASQNKPIGQYKTLELGGLVDKIHYTIAEPLDCTVFVCHQLRGITGRMGVTHASTHADAEWCSSFANNAWFCMVLGNKDTEHNVVNLSWTKTRRGVGSSVICKINGDFGCLVDASDQYALDHAAKRFVEVGGGNDNSYSYGPTHEVREPDNFLSSAAEYV